MRVFDIAPALWNVRRAIKGCTGSIPLSQIQASLSLGTRSMFLPLSFPMDGVPIEQRSQFGVLVRSEGDLDLAKHNGASTVCVRCPSNDLLARMGHREGAAFWSSAEAMFACTESCYTANGLQYASLTAAIRETSELLEKAASRELQTILLLDSALGCRYKASLEVPALIDLTNNFLEDGLAQHVIWEEGPRGGVFRGKGQPLYPSLLVPRVAENLCKTAVAGGVDMARVSFMLRDNGFTTNEVFGKLMLMSSSPCLADSFGISKHIVGAAVDAPSPYLTCSQLLSTFAEFYGEECPESLLDDIEGYVMIEEELQKCNFRSDDVENDLVS